MTIEEQIRRITGEEARKFPSFPAYLITEKGRVFTTLNKGPKSTQVFKELKTQVKQNGYVGFRVSLGQGRRKDILVHSAVALTFLGEKPSPMHQVRHLDGNKKNNKVENLAWGTPKENCQDRILHGVQARGRQTVSNWKLTDLEVCEIRHLANHTNMKQKDIGKLYGIVQGQVSSIKLGKSWRFVKIEGET